VRRCCTTCLQDRLERRLHPALFGGVMREYPQWREGDPVTLFPQAAASGESAEAGALRKVVPGIQACRDTRTWARPASQPVPGFNFSL